MRNARTALLLCSLLSSLSCTIWHAPVRELDRNVRVDALPAGPTAVEYVEARFHSFHASLSSSELRQVAEAVVEESLANDLPWDLVLALIHTESGFHNFAVSHVGAMGLMQIMPATGEGLAREEQVAWHGPDTLFQPLVNVKLGTRYLAWLHGRYQRQSSARGL